MISRRFLENFFAGFALGIIAMASYLASIVLISLLPSPAGLTYVIIIFPICCGLLLHAIRGTQ